MHEASAGATFRALHENPDIFVKPNAWDVDTARILTALGFPALATTSAGLAYTLGRRDARRAVRRADALAQARTIVQATELRVSADLENGFADDPQGVADTATRAAATGLAGCSIEDATGTPGSAIYAFDLPVERIAAAAEAARAAPVDFLPTARAENFLNGHPDIDDTITRLQAFESAGIA